MLKLKYKGFNNNVKKEHFTETFSQQSSYFIYKNLEKKEDLLQQRKLQKFCFKFYTSLNNFFCILYRVMFKNI